MFRSRMFRSRWLGPACMALALTGAARGQGTSAAKAPADAAERIGTVRELDRPPLRCRVLRSWTEQDGSKCMQVQPLEGGEVMTIVEAPGHGKPGPMRIFHPARTTTPAAPAPAPVTAPPPVAARPE